MYDLPDMGDRQSYAVALEEATAIEGFQQNDRRSCAAFFCLLLFRQYLVHLRQGSVNAKSQYTFYTSLTSKNARVARASKSSCC